MNPEIYNQYLKEAAEKEIQKASAAGIKPEYARECYMKAARFYRCLSVSVQKDRALYQKLYEQCERKANGETVVSPEQKKEKLPNTDATKDTSGKERQFREYKEKYGLDISMPNSCITFDELIGLAEAKETIHEDLIYPLKNSWAFANYGLEAEGKMLLEGPPGTGKTTFAKAVANEFEGPFVNVVCSTLVDSKIGETAKNIDKLFTSVREMVKTEEVPVILFFDEFDSIARSRGSDNKTAEEAVPTLIRQLDGFDTDNRNIIIIAATNIKSKLDEAILSRFKNSMYIPLPNAIDRAEMFRKKLQSTVKKNKNEYTKILESRLPTIDFQKLSAETEGFSGRDITMVIDKFLRCLAKTDAKISPEPLKDYMSTFSSLIAIRKKGKEEH